MQADLARRVDALVIADGARRELDRVHVLGVRRAADEGGHVLVDALVDNRRELLELSSVAHHTDAPDRSDDAYR